MANMMNMEYGGGDLNRNTAGQRVVVPGTIAAIKNAAAGTLANGGANAAAGLSAGLKQGTSTSTPKYRATGSSGTGMESADTGLGYLDYLSAALEARRQAIANANAALNKQGQAAEQSYKNQMDQARQDYQKLRNQSELNKYKSLRSLRETQANRGLLNSGAGRQENLNVNATYGNALNEIGIQEQNELSRIQQAITQMWADIAARQAQNEAMVSSDFTSGLISALSNPLYQYGGVSDEAKGLANTQLNVNPAVANGMFQGLTPAQIAALFGKDQANYLNKIGSVYSNINY